MSTAVIRYQTTPETADENQRLVEKVFAELATVAPAGLSYSTLRLDDRVTFVHVVDGEGLTDLAAFQEFQRTLPERLVAGPTRDDGTRIGSYSG